MKARITASSLLAALVLVLPAVAAAQEEGSVVPPENSAATQYTEAVPTAGGDKPTGGHHKPTPAKVLGEENAHKLQSQGRDGREVARVVAETAPETDSGSAGGPAAAPPEENGAAQDRSKGQSGGGGKAPDMAAKQPQNPPAAQPTGPVSTELPDGSSALGQVIGEATGSSSSGGLGLLLPLAILAAIAWALAYLWQQRRPAE